MSGEFTNVLAVAACGPVVAVAEAVTIPLLRRAATIDMPGHPPSPTVPTPRGGRIPVAPGVPFPSGGAAAARRVAFWPWTRGAARGAMAFGGGYAAVPGRASMAGWGALRELPPEAALGPLVLYFAGRAWTLQRRLRAGGRWLE